jgi:glutamate racemase
MNTIKSNPIGFFDSGIGGTSIWQEVNKLLPKENTIYLADSKNAPYGQKSKEKILEYCIKNTEFLLNKNAKIIVVACNTATTNAINYLRENYDIPFIGIEPAIKKAGLVTKNKKIGVLATKGTINSKLFEKTSNKIDHSIKIIEQIGYGLVELIENGEIHSSKMEKHIYSCLDPMLKENIDALVLGCTHYAFLIPQIKKIVGNRIQIIDSGLAVAKQTKRILTSGDQINSTINKKTFHNFYINRESKILVEILKNHNPIKVIERDF